MFIIPSHADYSRNQEKCKEDEYPCIVCGLPCPNPMWMVRIWYGSEAVMEEEAAVLEISAPGGDLGMQPLGTQCLKKHPELKPYAVKAAK